MKIMVTYTNAVLKYFHTHTNFTFLQSTVSTSIHTELPPNTWDFSVDSVRRGEGKEVYFLENFQKAGF